MKAAKVEKQCPCVYKRTCALTWQYSGLWNLDLQFLSQINYRRRKLRKLQTLFLLIYKPLKSSLVLYTAMASNNVLCKLIMLILVTIIFASNNVATRNLLSMPHLASKLLSCITFNVDVISFERDWDYILRVLKSHSKYIVQEILKKCILCI